MERFEGVIFDMDGVLIDSESICDRIWIRLAKEMNLSDIEDAIVENRGCNTDLMAKNLTARFSLLAKRFWKVQGKSATKKLWKKQKENIVSIR